MLHAALILALALEAKTPCNNEFLQNSWALLKAARWGQSPYEQAAFAVLDANGRVTFVMWQFDHMTFEAEYRGPVPANAFAIVHTHPNGRLMPSDDDRATAQRLGIFVYVVTRTAITRTAGGRSEFVILGDWNPELCAQH